MEEPELLTATGLGGPRQPEDQVHVRVGDEELGVGAVEHDHAHRVVGFHGAAEPVQLEHEVEVEQVDRRVVDRGAGDAGIGAHPEGGVLVVLVGHPARVRTTAMDVADLDPDPFVQVGRWLDDVVAAGLPEPTAMVLATADRAAHPVARLVLLKGLDRDGFVWFTNYESRKGTDLETNPYASLLFPWYPLRRQVIVTGLVARLPADESDAYFETRDRGSQLAAWASDQSRAIPDRAYLDERVLDATARFEGGPVARPPHWGGYRLTPDAIELWSGQPSRLHDRLRYVSAPGELTGWRIERLAP